MHYHADYSQTSSADKFGSTAMKQFIDYIPLLVFFTVWAMDERSVSIAGFEHSIGGIFSAAEFLLLASVLVYGSLLLYQKRLDKFQWITAGAVILCVDKWISFFELGQNLLQVINIHGGVDH